MSTRRFLSPFVIACALVVLSLAAGCSADRFNDAGCASDSECRLGRICNAGLCVDPGSVSHTMGPDAGADADTNPDADAGPTTDGGDARADTRPDVSAFIGTWNMTASGTVTEVNGQTHDLNNQQMFVTISEGVDSNLIIDMQDGHGFCPIKANVDGPSHFTILDSPCDLSQNGQTAHYSDLGGDGQVDANGVLFFSYRGSMQADIPNGPAMQARFDTRFRGTQVQATP